MRPFMAFGGVVGIARLMVLFPVVHMPGPTLGRRAEAASPPDHSVVAGGAAVLDSCNCGSTVGRYSWADVNCDGAVNPVDVVRMDNYVYKSQLSQLVNCPGVVYPNIPPPGPNPDATCPRKLGDANWDDEVNPLDVVLYLRCLYKAGDCPICNNPCLSTMCN